MKTFGKIFCYVVLAIAAFLSLFPFYFMFVSGTNTNNQILSVPPKLTIGKELAENFAILTGKMDLLTSIWNTMFVSVVYTVLALLIFSAAGYALAKFDFKGKKIIFGFVMGSMMIPPLVMYVPLFEMMIKFNMTDNHWAVILPLLANAFGIFLMRQNMLNFPTALLEAGRIDGIGEIGLFFRIVLPNIKPALGALVIYMFTSMWNNFMWPLIILGSEEQYTLPIALAMLDGNPTNKNYAVILLATAVATLPILVIFLIFQKQFVAGVMGGAVKE
ncbi:MAG: carbohydrate ABC transporter permease [Lachnospiraceae bacterium]